ncbi:transcriptional regulator [Palaeococcus pacificus DY20341]|uniref:Transcriptional regulator n=1 Tax=Palaeococcus pacificus DY20341 TaxID=1343739 RepID=A0A075LUI5_9EURY|nr:transcriptional regulator [Palaeococcus pacificus DY20341]
MHEKLESLLRSLGVKKSEIRIYKLLLEKNIPLRIKEIQREVGLSERSVRAHVLNLYRRGFLKRKLIEEGWLGYTYTAVSPQELLERLKENVVKKINEIERELKETDEVKGP